MIDEKKLWEECFVEMEKQKRKTLKIFEVADWKEIDEDNESIDKIKKCMEEFRTYELTILNKITNAFSEILLYGRPFVVYSVFAMRSIAGLLEANFKENEKGLYKSLDENFMGAGVILPEKDKKDE